MEIHIKKRSAKNNASFNIYKLIIYFSIIESTADLSISNG